VRLYIYRTHTKEPIGIEKKHEHVASIGDWLE